MYCLLFAGLVFISSIRAEESYQSSRGYETTQGFHPLIATLAHWSMPVGSILMLVLAIVVALAIIRLRRILLPRAALTFAVFQIAFFLKPYLDDSAPIDMVLLEALTVLAWYFVIAVGITTMLFLGAPVKRFYLAFSIGMVGFLLANIFQWFANQEVMAWAGRLAGVTAHPNHLGINSAIGFLLSLYYLFSETSYKSRILWLISSLGFLFFLIGSSSRAALLSTFVGAIVSFKFIGPVKAIGFLGLAITAVGMGIVNDNIDPTRLWEGDDTRSGVFSNLIDIFLSSPITGKTLGKGEVYNESSYLFTAAYFGIVGLSLLIVPIALLLRFIQPVIISKVRKSSQYIFVLNATMGFIMIFYPMFEATFIESYTPRIILIFMVMAVAEWIYITYFKRKAYRYNRVGRPDLLISTSYKIPRSS